MKKEENSEEQEIKLEIVPHYTWKCEVLGLTDSSTVTLKVEKPPFIFWRWMQYLVFGNKWGKIKK